MAGALDYAYKQGLLNRDVKPANIMQSGQSVTVCPVSRTGS